MRTIVAFLLVGTTAHAADSRVHRDLAYAEPKNERQTLDVYAPTAGKTHPVVFWIHGGGWQRGDKTEVQAKPQAFVDKGFVFVSTNYRFVPNVTIKEMAGDIAKAIRWTHDHAKDYGGDPNTICVMGHSAGAQLAALLCTDDRYLKAEGLSLSIIQGCVPVDGDTYDVPMQIATVEERRADIYKQKFGDEQSQKDLSPVTHVAKGKHIPPFLILHVADHAETKMQSRRLAEALEDAGVSAKAFPAEGKNHTTINSELGVSGDEPTKAVFDFLGEVLNRTKRTTQKLYVTNSAGQSVHVIDLGTFKVTAEIKTGERPHGATVSADGRRFFTSIESDQKLLVIDTGTDQVAKSIQLSGLPNQCAVTPDGKYVGVPIRRGDSVDIVDVPQGRVVQNLPVKVPHNCYNARRNDHVFVTSMGENKVNLIDLKSLSYIAEIPVGGVPRPLAVTNDEATLYCAVSDLHGFVIADIPQRKVVQTIELPPLPAGVQFPVPHTPTHGLELTPDERELWITSCGTDTVYVYNTSSKQIVGKVGVGRGPNWVTFSPDGRYCCVSNVLSDDVSIIDAVKRQEIARVKVGSQPKRLVVARVP